MTLHRVFSETKHPPPLVGHVHIQTPQGALELAVVNLSERWDWAEGALNLVALKPREDWAELALFDAAARPMVVIATKTATRFNIVISFGLFLGLPWDVLGTSAQLSPRAGTVVHQSAKKSATLVHLAFIEPQDLCLRNERLWWRQITPCRGSASRR